MGLTALPPRREHGREQRSGKPIQQPPEDDKRVKIDENRVLHNNRQSEYAPTDQGKLDAAAKSRGEESALPAHHDREKKSDAASGENVESAGKKIT